jgi:putative hydrolase of the HAD superfamily
MSPMTTSPLTAICFDAGNTLLYCDPSPAEVYARALSRHGRAVTPDHVAPVFAEAWAEMQLTTRPGQDRYTSEPGGERAWWGRFLRTVLARLEHDAPWQALLDELYGAFSRPDLWHVFPEVPATLSELRHRGFRLGVISNWDTRLPDILDQLDLTQWFDDIAVSSLEGVEKPAREIFDRSVARLGVPAAEAVHVGDSPVEDYQGALNAGLRALLIDRHGTFAGNGMRRIGSVDEVLSLYS